MSLYRNSIWFLNGMSQYTSQGGARSRAFILRVQRSQMGWFRHLVRMFPEREVNVVRCFGHIPPGQDLGTDHKPTGLCLIAGQGMPQDLPGRGYEAASKDFDPEDLEVSVVGRSFMITGANSGIGKATALGIAKKGGTVHIVCRNQDKAEEARRQIIYETENTEIHVHIVDLSQTCKVWEFAEAFKKQYPSLNVLINNAGCMLHKREFNEEGIEKNFATNTMGVYILTQTLIPLLQKSRDPRVITVSSGGMLVQKLQVDDLQSENGNFDGLMVYAQNKRQQVVLTQHWAKTNPIIHFSAMHPGWVDTPAVSTSMPQFHQMMGDRLRSVDQGADTVLWLALSRAASRTRSGQFFQDRKPVPDHLPLAWTHSSAEEIKSFVTQLETLAQAVQSHPDLNLEALPGPSKVEFD